MHVAYSSETVSKDVASTKQLFIDNDVIAVVKNVTRRQHRPVKHPSNPLIRRDRPWEFSTYFRTSAFGVVNDSQAGHFKCWYEDYYSYFNSEQHRPSVESRLFYAQSDDGLTWEKPALGKHFIDGHDTNAVIDTGPDVTEAAPSFLLDEAEPNPARRFKMIYCKCERRSTGLHGAGLCMNFSPNGIDWTPYEGNPIFPRWDDDTEILTYDPIDRKYILWGRYGGHPGRSVHPSFDAWFAPVYPARPEGIWGTRRRIYRLESEDGLNWSDAALILEPGEKDNLDDGHYGFVPWRAGEMHLGILNVLHQVDNTIDMYLLHSRDGVDWKRFLDHSPFVPRGGDGSCDQFDIETTNQPLVIGDELWFYYGGMNVHDDWWIYGRAEGLDLPETRDPSLAQNGHHLCLATLRLDGYVSLDATVREGWVETKPLFSTGAHLYINGRCNRDGFVEVEIMDGWNNVWEEFSRKDCRTFTGDRVRHRMEWSGGSRVNEVPGPVKLRFYLRSAELYGFQFANE